MASNLYPGPFNFKQWIDEHRHRLKPPVGNQVVWPDGEFIIMVVGGPNKRKDYHYNETAEFFYQLEGDMVLRIMDEGKPREIPIREGEIFLLPPRVPHSPQRFENTVGLVVEVKRPPGMMDALRWYCENCHRLLHEEKFYLKDIVKELPILFERFYSDEEKRTCKSCGHVMAPI